jgi:hypothetical protein
MLPNLIFINVLFSLNPHLIVEETGIPRDYGIFPPLLGKQNLPKRTR